MAEIDKLLYDMKDVNATDLHMTSGCPPKMRVHGDIEPLDMELLTDEGLERMFFEIISPKQKETFLETNELDFAYGLPGYARFRTNYYAHQYGIGAVFRRIPEQMMSFEQLGLPNAVLQFVEIGFGLVIVTGPTGSGKTTTLASIIDYMNTNYTKHILTIEEPIEFVHQHKKSLITQREIGIHTENFGAALRCAMRMDPDVILIGEMRDAETIGLALTCAEMGMLVFGTLHTNSASRTVDRIIDVFPAEEQERIRIMLANSLTGVVAEQLLRTADGKGRAAAFEILVGTPAIGSLIRSAQVSKIDSEIQQGGRYGMQTMDLHILRLLQAERITGLEAYQKAFDKRTFEEYWDLGAVGGEALP